MLSKENILIEKKTVTFFCARFFIKFLLLTTVAFGNFVSGMKIKPIRFHSLGKLRCSL